MPTLDNRGSGLQDRAVGGAEAVPVREPGEEGTGLGSHPLQRAAAPSSSPYEEKPFSIFSEGAEQPPTQPLTRLQAQDLCTRTRPQVPVPSRELKRGSFRIWVVSLVLMASLDRRSPRLPTWVSRFSRSLRLRPGRVSGSVADPDVQQIQCPFSLN